MKTIHLTQNKVAIVDDEDFELLSKHKWCASYSKAMSSYYALTNIRNDLGKYRTVKMHRMVMMVSGKEMIDHINHDTLDNRKCNLRICLSSNNQHNGKIRSDNTSSYKGVILNKKSGRWRSRIMYNGKRIHLGYFDTPLEAAYAYDNAAIEMFGEFALTNGMLGLL